jgi:negative regulator of sigma E activity
MNYVHTVNRQQSIRRQLNLKGESETITIDFSPWQEEVDETITGVTWVVESGGAAISNDTLNSNVASALVTFSGSGISLIKVTASTSADDAVEYIRVKAREPYRYSYDYGVYQE